MPTRRRLAAKRLDDWEVRVDERLGEFVRLEVVDGIGTIRLDRPPVNALNAQVQQELRAAAQAVTADPAVRAVVLHGAGRHFAAGADITEFTTVAYQEIVAQSGALSGVCDALARIPKPVVAAVTGFALGGGCELALACDWRVIAEDARLGLPEIKLGLIPGAGGTQRLARLIGPAKAKDLIFSGRTVESEEALRIGLADRVAPAAEVYDTAVALVRPFTTGPALALRAAKQAVDGGLSLDLASGIALETHLFAGLFATDDRIEGTTAFVEKRAPKFTGR